METKTVVVELEDNAYRNEERFQAELKRLRDANPNVDLVVITKPFTFKALS